MLIEFRKERNKYIVELWADDTDTSWTGFKEPYPEETYKHVNEWCKAQFGYSARTAYHIFELKKHSHLEWFILKWQ